MKNKILGFLAIITSLFFVNAAFAAVDPLSPPTNVAVSNVTYQGATVSWTQSVDTDPKAGLIQYTVVATPVSNSYPVVTKNARGFATTTLFAGTGTNQLQLGVSYNVTVTAIDDDNNTSAPSSPAVSLVMPSTAPVSNVQVNTITTNSANITWSPAQDVAKKNATFEYTVKIKPADAGSSAPVPPQPASTSGTSVSVSQLLPATMYQFTIESKESGGATATSQRYWVLTQAQTSYLMLNFPTTVTFPVYIYQQQATGVLNQITYLAGSSQNLFLSAYDPTSTSGNYVFYYADSASKSGYVYCTLSLSNGQIASSTNQCPGITSNSITQFPVVSANGGAEFIQPNAYALNVGQGTWADAPTAPPSPQATDYNQPRTFTFVNNTQYKAIRIGMACTTANNSHNPNCQNVSDLFASEFPNGLPQGQPAVFTIDNKTAEKGNYPAGLDSAAFYVSAFQNSNGAWVNTGGYEANPESKHPYATKMELTWQGIKADPNKGPLKWVQNTNLDVSAVDGYNFGVILYPAFPSYCLSTIGGESTNAMGVNIYSQQNPIAQLLPQNNESLSALCSSSSQLPTNGSGTAWNLSLLSSNGDFKGCYNPCSYAVANGLPQTTIDQYCCTGSDATWQSCKVAGTSSYVTNMNPPISTGIYRFAYDDATGDFGCPGMTNYVVSIVSTAANTISVGGAPTATPTLNSANLTWSAATDSNVSATVNYTVQLAYAGQPTVQVPNSSIAISGTTAQITGLNPNTSYQATVVASDNSGAVAAYPTVIFTTTNTPVNALTLSNPVQTALSDNGAAYSWTESDTDPKAGTIKYSVQSMTPTSVLPTFDGNTAAWNNSLQPNTPYSVVIKATDEDGNTATLPISFTTTTGAYSFTITQPTVGDITQTTAAINYVGTDTDPKAGDIQYTATATSSNGGATVITQPLQTSAPVISGLTPGKTYTVVVTGKDSDNNTATSPASAPFTMGAYAFTITQPVVSGVTQTTANVDFTFSDNDPNGDLPTFTATATSTDGGATVTQAIPAGTTQLTGFTPGKTYTIVVTGVDQDKKTATSPASASFTMAANYVFTIGQPSVTNVAQTTATVNWTASDNDPNANPITYTVTATPTSGSPVVQTVQNAVTANLTGLTANTAYTVVVTGADSDNNNATSQSASFTTQAAATAFTVYYDANQSGKGIARIWWNKIPGETEDNTTAVATGPSNITGTVDVGPHEEATGEFTGVLPGEYTAVVTVTVDGQVYQGSVQFPN